MAKKPSELEWYEYPQRKPQKEGYYFVANVNGFVTSVAFWDKQQENFYASNAIGEDPIEVSYFMPEPDPPWNFWE